ncbi:substrate-binding domain-containing protein [Oscillospiraceae bacterium PP1C4]
MKKPKIALVFTLIILSGLMIFKLTQYIYLSEEKPKAFNPQNPTYRFVCIYSGSSDHYKQALQEGLREADQEFDVWVKFHEFKSFEVDKHCEEFDKAIASKVDGIITNVPENTVIEEYIEAAYNRNIPVITIENDLPGSKRISFIGTNSYEYGVNAGRLMISATGGKSKTVVFRSAGSSKFDLKNQGFQDTIKEYLPMSTEPFYIQEPSIMEYTNMAQSIFLNSPSVDSFFCADTESTLGVVKAMIEFNKTNCAVIGAGDSDKILKQIKNGIIFGSLVEDPYSIGYLSVENMLRHKNGERISESVNTDVMAITKQNIDSIMVGRENEDDHT